VRLDVYLVETGYFESRNRALEAIKTGRVTVDGKKAKPSMQFKDCGVIDVANEKFYVSRAGRKLEAFLSEHPLSIEGRRCLDVGSSTGGFAQILLEHNPSSLTCVDVGSNQLHPRIHPSVILFEQTDIRDFSDIQGFDIITCDVSFISVLEIVVAIDSLAKEDIVILYKPQFEVGRLVKRDSKGVVVDVDAIRHNKMLFEQQCEAIHWRELVCKESKVQGKEGNIEYFYHFKKVKN